MPEMNIRASFRIVMRTEATHNCAVCGKPIPPMSTALNASGRIFGNWFNEYFCLGECALERISNIPDQELAKRLQSQISDLKAFSRCS